MASLRSRRACKRLFVTVGTTKFEPLIEKITSHEVLKILGELGFTEVSLQIGNGNAEAAETANDRKDSTLPQVSHFRYKSSILEDISAADMVVSHAGSGSILDCLTAGKNPLVVINDELMDNHQIELAEKLAQEGYLHYCYVYDILTALSNVTWDTLKPYPPGQGEKFSQYLEERLGFGEI